MLFNIKRKRRIVANCTGLLNLNPYGFRGFESHRFRLIPNAKKNLHECKYHFDGMLKSLNVEELEINFAAFVNSARNVTFVLQKEFAHNPIFKEWYGDKDNPKKGTKNMR